MATFNINQTFKRLRNRYRLVIMNDDTFEELATFKLNRITVYIAVSTLFIVLITATVALLWFTPLKQLTPGYNQSFGVDAKYKQLKIETDSIAKVTTLQTSYISNLQKLLTNQNPTTALDTNLLQIDTIHQ